MNAWIRGKFDIDPCCRLREAFVFWLKRKLLGDDIGSAEVRPFWVRPIKASMDFAGCCRLYWKLTYSWQDGRKCIWHLLAHRKFDEACEYCHYRRSVREGIGMGW